MEGLAVKRRRVYSVEANRIEEAAFSRKYVSYLVPALKKIKERTGNYKEEEENSDSLKKVVKYEVDMALVLSAQASAWSNALKLSLQNGVLSSSFSPPPPPSSSSNTTKTQNLMAAPADNEKEEDGCDDGGGGSGEEEEAMNRLRRLVPGGEEMCNEQEMVAEFKSYARFLQMQVNILQFLAHQTHSF